MTGDAKADNIALPLPLPALRESGPVITALASLNTAHTAPARALWLRWGLFHSASP